MFRAFGLAIIYLSAHTADSRLMRKVLMNFTPPSSNAVQNERILSNNSDSGAVIYRRLLCGAILAG